MHGFSSRGWTSQRPRSTVNHIDEEARNKTMQFNDFKTQMSNLAGPTDLVALSISG